MKFLKSKQAKDSNVIGISLTSGKTLQQQIFDYIESRLVTEYILSQKVFKFCF